MKAILSVCLALVFASACRKADDIDAEMKWSCVRTTTGGLPTATPECVEDLKRENSIILRRYVPEAVLDKVGKIMGYKLREKAG